MSDNTDMNVEVIDLTQDNDDDSVMEDVEKTKVKVRYKQKTYHAPHLYSYSQPSRFITL